MSREDDLLIDPSLVQRTCRLHIRRVDDNTIVESIDIGFDLTPARIEQKLRSLSHGMNTAYYVDDKEVADEQRRRGTPGQAIVERNRKQFE